MTEIFYEMETLKFTFIRFFFVSSSVLKVLNVSFVVAVKSVIDHNFCTKGTWKNSKGKCKASRLMIKLKRIRLCLFLCEFVTSKSFESLATYF
jgi:hypothetical protein